MEIMGAHKMQGRNFDASDNVFGEVLSVFKFKSNKIFLYFYSSGIRRKNSTAERQQSFSVYKEGTGRMVFLK
jgi:hypothetical protein